VLSICGIPQSRYLIGATTDDFMIVDALNRTFHVYIPPTYSQNRATAVVFLLHGGFGTGLQAESAYGMNTVANANNFIVVYPDGFLRTWNAGLCCGAAAAMNIDDVKFISLLIDRLESFLCVNSNQVFSTGMSNGAIMSHRLGCELSNRIAGIAPVEGTMGVMNCNPSNPVPVFEIHGTADMDVPWLGGVGCGGFGTNFTSVPYTINTWTNINHCNCQYGDTGCTSTYLRQGDGICISYGSCSGVSVILCNITGGGHTWSGGEANQFAGVGCNNNVGTFPASLQIWNFFSTINRRK